MSLLSATESPCIEYVLESCMGWGPWYYRGNGVIFMTDTEVIAGWG